MPPRFHATPRESIAEIVRETVHIDDTTFTLLRPIDSDALMDHPWVRSAYAADGYTPYWAKVWPSARMLAKVLRREPVPRGPRDMLEVGCGLGLAGLAALSRGWRVTFSDVDTTALEFAADNARHHGFMDFTTRPLDFRCPPTDTQYSRVIGSDLMYEQRLVEPLIDLLHTVLAPGGTALITDPDRQPARVFRGKLREEGFDVASSFVRAGEPGGDRVKGTLYRIRHAADVSET